MNWYYKEKFDADHFWELKGVVPQLSAHNTKFTYKRICKIPDKTTWERFFVNAHYLTQQNYF